MSRHFHSGSGLGIGLHLTLTGTFDSRSLAQSGLWICSTFRFVMLGR